MDYYIQRIAFAFAIAGPTSEYVEDGLQRHKQPKAAPQVRNLHFRGS